MTKGERLSEKTKNRVKKKKKKKQDRDASVLVMTTETITREDDYWRYRRYLKPHAKPDSPSHASEYY